MHSSTEVNRKLILNSTLHKITKIGKGRLECKSVIGPEKIPHRETFRFCFIHFTKERVQSS